MVKHNGHAAKALTYVGQMEDGADVVAYLRHHCQRVGPIQLQRRCDGIEIGVARYFNGRDWVGPVEINVEHKDLCTGNLGPKTWEMGTLMWFADETQPLYRATLAKLQPHLAEIGFRGDIDINCIVNAEGVFPLEITARFGFPALQLQMAMTTPPLGRLPARAGARRDRALFAPRPIRRHRAGRRATLSLPGRVSRIRPAIRRCCSARRRRRKNGRASISKKSGTTGAATNTASPPTAVSRCMSAAPARPSRPRGPPPMP